MEMLHIAGPSPLGFASGHVTSGPLAIVCSACGRQCLGGDTWVALPVSPMSQIVAVLCPTCSRAWAQSHMASTLSVTSSQDDSD
jgi:hypothetical protein